MKYMFFPLLIVLCCFSDFGYAQKNIIDEVIWVVGDESILRSEVEEQKLRAQYEGAPIQGDPYCVIPEQIAIQKLYLHQASLDSLTVNESSVINQVEARINYFVSQIGSKEKMEEYFKKSTSELRESLREMIRNQQLIQQMQQKLVSHIKSTPADVRRYFSQLSVDSVPDVAAQVELQLICVMAQRRKACATSRFVCVEMGFGVEAIGVH